MADITDATRRGRKREAAALADLALPLAARLRDDDRAGVIRLFGEIVTGIERDLRRRLALPLDGEAGVSLVRLPAEGDIVAVLVRRGREARLAAALHDAAARSRELDPLAVGAPIAALGGDDDATVAAAARRLIAGERALIGESGDAVAGMAELPADLYRRLVWQVAAVVRHHLVHGGPSDEAAADGAIAIAVEASLADYDEGAALAGLQTNLASALAAVDRLGDTLIVQALAAGHVGFTVAALGLRAGVPFAAAWDMAVDDDGAMLLPLCRAAGVGRNAAAELAVRLDLHGDDAILADRIDRYDAIAPADAAAAMAIWRLDPVYRGTIADLGGSDGR